MRAFSWYPLIPGTLKLDSILSLFKCVLLSCFVVPFPGKVVQGPVFEPAPPRASQEADAADDGAPAAGAAESAASHGGSLSNLAGSALCLISSKLLPSCRPLMLKGPLF